MASRSGAPRAAPPPKPVAQARVYDQRMAQERSWRMGILAAILILISIPILPNPIGPIPNPMASMLPGQQPTLTIDWRGALWRLVAPTLLLPIPPEGVDLPPGVPRVPLLKLLHVGVAMGGFGFCMTLVQHLVSIYAQRTRPLTATHTYMRLTLPPSVTLTPMDGVSLLRTVHGMLPSGNLLQGTPVPLSLRWNARPEQPVEQAVTVCGPPMLRTSIQKTLEGLDRGARVEVVQDPFLEALGPGRFLCWADVRQVVGRDFPIVTASTEGTPVLDALFPALAPQTGGIIGDVQILVSPVPDRAWRLPVLARLEAFRADAAAAERRAMEAKAAGPAFAVHIRLRAIAETPEASQAMVETLGATLASTAQAVASVQQRLIAGPPQVLPAVVEPPPPVPRTHTSVAWALGGAVAVLCAALLLLHGSPWPTWLWVPCGASIPPLVVRIWHRRRHQEDRYWRYLTVTRGVMPPTNPRVVPLIGAWLPPRG